MRPCKALSGWDGAGAAQFYGERSLPGARESFERIDINADQRDDLLARYAWGEFEVWLSNGARFTAGGSFTTPYSDAGGWNESHRFY